MSLWCNERYTQQMTTGARKHSGGYPTFEHLNLGVGYSKQDRPLGWGRHPYRNWPRTYPWGWVVCYAAAPGGCLWCIPQGITHTFWFILKIRLKPSRKPGELPWPPVGGSPRYDLIQSMLCVFAFLSVTTDLFIAEMDSDLKIILLSAPDSDSIEWNGIQLWADNTYDGV